MIGALFQVLLRCHTALLTLTWAERKARPPHCFRRELLLVYMTFPV